MITGLNHLSIAVRNLPVSFKFYKDILGFKPLCRWSKGTYLLAGDLWFCLFEDLKASPGQGYTHFAFNVSRETFPKFIDRLKKAKVHLWKENISEGDSVYFLDPDGYQLEIHVGDWKSRLSHKKQHPWEEVEFFDLPCDSVKKS